jgi:hypothetical protein
MAVTELGRFINSDGAAYSVSENHSQRLTDALPQFRQQRFNRWFPLSQSIEGYPQHIRDGDQLVIGDAPPPKLDFCNQGALHVPAVNLQFSGQIALRPPFCLSRMADLLTKRISRWLGFRRGWVPAGVCHDWHLTIGTGRAGMGATGGTFCHSHGSPHFTSNINVFNNKKEHP